MILRSATHGLVLRGSFYNCEILWKGFIEEQPDLFLTFLMTWSQAKYENERNRLTCILTTNLQFLFVSVKRTTNDYSTLYQSTVYRNGP